MGDYALDDKTAIDTFRHMVLQKTNDDRTRDVIKYSRLRAP